MCAYLCLYISVEDYHYFMYYQPNITLFLEIDF